MKTNIQEIRKKYIANPPECFTSKDIRSMSGEELLDMDHFMNEELEDNLVEEGFYIFYIFYLLLYHRTSAPFPSYSTYFHEHTFLFSL